MLGDEAAYFLNKRVIERRERNIPVMQGVHRAEVGYIIPGVIYDITGSYGGVYLIAAVFMAIIIVAVIRFYAARGKMVAAEA